MLSASSRRRIVAGYALAGAGRTAFKLAVVTVVALAVGMDLNAGGLDLVGLYTLALLVNLGSVLFATGVAMRLRTMQAGPAMQIPAFLALFLSPVFVPRDLLAGWVDAAASVNPVTVILEAERGLIAGDPTKLGLAFAIAAGLVSVFVVWALRGLRSAERTA